MKYRRFSVCCLHTLPALLLLLFACSHLMAADVSLAWDPSVTPNIVGYKVYFGNASHTYGPPIVIDNQTTYTVTGLTSGTFYFAVTAYDALGNESDFSNEVSQVIGSSDPTPSDTTPPAISGVMDSNISSTGAAILWVTNEAADSQVEYGTTESYGNSATLDTGMTLSHMQVLSGLTAGTAYYYRVKSRDAAGNLAVSGNYTFTTAASADTTPPVISGVTAANVTDTSALILWATNEAADTQIEYGTTTAYGSGIALDPGMTLSHTQSLSGLAAGMIYHYRVKSRDAAGNLAASTDYTFTTGRDGLGPVITAVIVSDITDRSATISWVTDVPSDSVVEYGLAGQPRSKSALADPLTHHSLTLCELKKLSQYTFRVRSTDSEGNEAVSRDFTFETAGNGAVLLAMPHFSSNRENPNDDIMIGMAVANIGADPATLTFTAVDLLGNPVTGSGIVNPATRGLNPGSQFKMLDLSVFGEGLASSNSSGWIKVESTNSDVNGFFLTFNGGLTLMDGASFGHAVNDFVFTEIEPAGSTKIEIANTGPDAANVAFSLMSADGTALSVQNRVISGNGALTADLVGDLFQGTAPDPSGYVRMRSTGSVQPFQLMQKSAGDISSLPGQDATAGGTVLYSPQYVMGGPWRSSLSIVNLDSQPGIITLQLFDKNGVAVGMRTMEMAPKAKIRIVDPEFFAPLTPGTITSGFIRIGSDGIRLAGSTVFEDGSRESFASALPLIYRLKDSVLFSHIVSNDTYFTGIAIVNPNLFSATVTIEVFAADGRLIDRKHEVVPPMQKSSRLLTEYFPLLTGMDLSSGYILLSSDLPIASFSLFGKNDLSVLSAIPAQ